MRFVIYNLKTGEVRSAGNWTADSVANELAPGYGIGEVGESHFEGALKNYVFRPNPEQLAGARFVHGTVERKPKEEWDEEAESRELAQRAVARRFQWLDVNDIASIEVLLLVPSQFVRLPEPISTYTFAVESVPLTVTVKRRAPVPVAWDFDFGGYTVPLPQTQVSFTLSGRELFLLAAIKAKLKSLEPNVFVGPVIQDASLRFALKVTNHFIECYRVAYDDPEERPLGFADVRAGAIVTVLRDGHRQVSHSGISLRQLGRTFDGPQTENADQRDATLRDLLSKKAPPFAVVALAELKKAHIYGQYRECLVWAGVIISYMIDDILLTYLPKDSAEYRMLKTRSAEVRGKTKRESYFKKATGEMLREALKRLTGDDQLGDDVEKVLDNRNLLLHRRAAIGPAEGDLAFRTCMKFVNVFRHGVAYVQEPDWIF